MIILLLVLLLALLIGVYQKKIKNDWLNPILVFTVPLIFSYLVYLFFYYKEYQISNKTAYIYCFGIISFLIGIFLSERNTIFKKDKKCMKDFKTIPINHNLDIFLYIFSIMIGFFLIINLILLFINSGFSNVIFHIRYEAVYGTGVSPIIEYGMVIVSLYTYIKVYNYSISTKKYKYQKRKILILLTISFLNIFISMARTAIISLGLSLYYLYTFKDKKTYQNKKIKSMIKMYKNNLLIFLIILTIFYFIAYSTNRLGGANFLDKNFFIYSYLGKQIMNFDKVILNFVNCGNGYYTFGFIGRFLNGLGVVNLLSFNDFFNSYSLIGQDGAVYSFVGPLYFDFGTIGVIISMIMNGIFVGFLYKKSNKHMGSWTILYTTCLYSTFMSFFDYQFMMSSQLYFICLLIVLYIYNNNGKIIIKKG